MLEKIKDLFLPSEANNHKSSALSLSSLSFYITIVVVFQVGINILSFVNPNILGYATNISIDEIVRITNQKREENGLRPLALDPTLSAAAAGKAADMFGNNYWAHISPSGKTPWDFIVGAGYYYVYAGENLAKDFMDSAGVVGAWMASATHRDNVLNSKYQNVGVAVVNGRLNGMETTLVVQMFGARQSAAAPAEKSEMALGKKEEVSKVEPTAVPTVKEMAAVVGKVEQGGGPPVIGKQAIVALKPKVNVFGLTKNFSLVVVVFLLFLILVDIVVISSKRVRRLSGNSLFHFSFLLFILLAILLTTSGTIL